MYYGLTANDIINCFSQSISADYATNGFTGVEIIEEEISFQYEKLQSSLNSSVLSQLEKIDYEIVDVDASYQFSATLSPISGSVKAWRIEKTEIPCYDCWDIDDIEPITQLDVNSFETVDKTWDRDIYRIVISYEVDQDNLNINSLKSILRHMVACAIGNKLFPAGNNDEWSIVKYHCEEANKWLEIIKNWKPTELKKIKLLYPPLPWASIKTRRVN
jgi:hypothetical protein